MKTPDKGNKMYGGKENGFVALNVLRTEKKTFCQATKKKKKKQQQKKKKTTTK